MTIKAPFKVKCNIRMQGTCEKCSWRIVRIKNGNANWGLWWQLIKANLSDIAQKYATHEPQRQ